MFECEILHFLDFWGWSNIWDFTLALACKIFVCNFLVKVLRAIEISYGFIFAS